MLYFKSNQSTVQLFKMFASYIFVFMVSSLTHAENIGSSPLYQNGNYCLLPPYPEHGSYTDNHHIYATPGQRYSSVKLDISCDAGYLNNNTIKSIFCVNGEWSAAMPSCVRDFLGFCTVPTGDLRVEYRCLSFPGTLERSWECESMVSRRTIVRPICRFPGYFSRKVLPDMHCRDGMWDYTPICKRACGLTTQHQQLEGTSSNQLKLPWQVVIYQKTSEIYGERCGGSLITANKIISVSSLTHAENIGSSPLYQNGNYCLLPPYPEHGSYTDNHHIYATPGQRYSSVKLDISCDAGYLNNNTIKSIFCVNGEWSAAMPSCVRDFLGFCTVPTGDLRVEYRCLSFPGTLERSWECESMVSRRTIVRPICRFPGYFSRKVLPDMHCRDGMWDYTPICKRACGLTTQHQQLEGTSSNQLKLPWQVVIYQKTSEIYGERCGGSLITANKIISAAHCFFNYKNELRPATDFKLAVNKIYNIYNDTRDRNSQYSDAAEIIIPSSYRGNATNYEDNIAIVVVKKPFFFHLSVLPVCLDFDNDLDSTQLAEGNSGKITSWNFVVNNSQSFYVLNVVDCLYMKNEDCNTSVITYEQKYLTKDKFCTRHHDWPRSGSIEFGNGLAFLESDTQRYFLRGVFSRYVIESITGIHVRVMNLYTSIMKHEHFIKQHL